MFGAVLRHITATLWTSLPEPSLQGKDCGATGLSSWLTPIQGSYLHLGSSARRQFATEQLNSIRAALRKERSSAITRQRLSEQMNKRQILRHDSQFFPAL